MNSLLYYLLQVIVASGILYAYYHFALRNKKFHRYNRFYLLSATVISILIPFLNIPVYFTSEETHSSIVLQTLTTISPSYYSETISSPIIVASAKPNWVTWENVIYSFYILIAIIALIRIIISIRKIKTIIQKNPVEKLEHICFVNTDEPGTPFSFFRWLFWNRKIELQSEKGEQVFRHELFHIEQKHSVDVMFMELLTMIFWINPFFHLIKREIKAIHEFLADQFAITENKKWEYAELLLMQAMNTKINLTNPFFHNQIKRRITMITLSSKPGHQYLRKILVLPVAAIVLALFAFKYEEKNDKHVIHAERPFTVVIDAGHGGQNNGAISPDKNYKEADLSLKLCKSIEKFAKDYNITVVMTRENQNSPANAKTLKKDLSKRIEIANSAKPDAFISIHMNVSGKNEMQNEFSGIQAYITGKKEDENARTLASAILQEVSKVYTTDLEIKQRIEKGVYVLDHNNYPSVLLECGYIDNSNDLAFISNKNNQEKTARAILSALAKYANNIDLKKADNGLSKIKSVIDTTPRLYNNKIDNVLIIIDGKIKGIVKDLKQNANIDGINPDDIESMAVLKGDTATAKYGEKARNGAIEIHLKKNNHNTTDTIPRNTNSDDNKIFEKTEIEPSFAGGEQEWKKYLAKNLNQNIPIENKAPKGDYSVVVQFIVDTSGYISDIKTLTHFGYGMEDEAIRMIKLGPSWIPAIQNGHKVKAYKKQVLTFVIETDKKNNSPSSSFNNIDQPVFTSFGEKAETSPSFLGGEAAWKNFVESHLNKESFEQKNDQMVSLTWIKFVVNEDGSLSKLTPITKSWFGKEEEAIRLLKLSPKWIPATKKGKKIKYEWAQSFSFSIAPSRQIKGTGAVIPSEDNIAQKLGDIIFVSSVSDPKTNVTVSDKIEPLQNIEIGSSPWRKYFEKWVNTSLIAADKDLGEAIYYTLLFQFARNDDGTLSDIKCLNPYFADSKIAEQVTTLFKNISNTTQNETDKIREVKRYIQPLIFVLYTRNAT